VASRLISKPTQANPNPCCLAQSQFFLPTAFQTAPILKVTKKHQKEAFFQSNPLLAQGNNAQAAIKYIANQK
jgi:hypothetical protein